MDNKLTILLYHGITNSKSKGIENFSKKHISDKDFKEQIEFISKSCNIISMDDVVDIVSSKEKYPPKAVAVTFDDGFRNNCTVAAPILDEFHVPATFYITSGIINTETMYWVDELEDCINLSLKPSLELSLNKKVVFDLTSVSKKIIALTEIKAFCKNSTNEIKNEIVRQVIDATGVIPSVNHSENYKKMSWKELRELNMSDLFTIGGHSLYHNILSKISPFEKLSLDIQISIALLKYNLDKEIKHYSYPEGQAIHYNDDVINCLKNNGIICCPSAIDGINDSSIDLFNLKRIMVAFMGREFLYKLNSTKNKHH